MKRLDILMTILILLLVILTSISIYYVKQNHNQYKYRVSYNCDWNGCYIEYTNSIKKHGSCIDINNMTICGDYVIKDN